MSAGYYDEARAWRDWLLRAVAGSPGQLQIMYGLAGERRLGRVRARRGCRATRAAAPVRIGNAACDQLQLDVYGEVMDALHQARDGGLDATTGVGAAAGAASSTWSTRLAASRTRASGRCAARAQHFTHSKVMCWVAFDRAVRAIEEFGLAGPARALARAARRESTPRSAGEGYDRSKGAFVQRYGATALDASLLLLPLVGFLPPDDPRMLGTVAGDRARARAGRPRAPLPRRGRPSTACRRARAPSSPAASGSPTTTRCRGVAREARALFERLLGLANDVGLLAEEYDPRRGRQLGNFPQAFSHVALVNTAFNLGEAIKPAEERGERGIPAAATAGRSIVGGHP